MMRRLLPLILFAALPFAGCRSSDPTPPLLTPPASSGVYIVNEGTFTGGGGITFLDTRTDSVFQDAVAGASDWVFPNDMKVVGTKGYVAVNGVDRIDVVDLSAQAVIHAITFPAGRGPGFLAVSGDTMAVANYDGSVSLVDLRRDSVTATVDHVVGFPGGIAFGAGKVFVSDVGLWPATGNMVQVVLPGPAPGRDSVRVENAPGAIVAQGGALFVLASGTSRLYRLDPGTLTLEDSLQLSGYVSDATGDGEYLYIMNSDSVAKVEDNPLSIISTGHIRRTAGSYFYAISALRPAGLVYVTTVMSAGGSGRVESYHADGSVARAAFPCGVFPGAIAFRP